MHKYGAHYYHYIILPFPPCIVLVHRIPTHSLVHNNTNKNWCRWALLAFFTYSTRCIYYLIGASITSHWSVSTAVIIPIITYNYIFLTIKGTLAWDFWALIFIHKSKVSRPQINAPKYFPNFFCFPGVINKIRLFPGIATRKLIDLRVTIPGKSADFQVLLPKCRISKKQIENSNF